MWTSMSSILCLFCAKNPQNRNVYSEWGATPRHVFCVSMGAGSSCAVYTRMMQGIIEGGYACAGATLASFVLALLFFTSELLYYKTVSLQSALQPMIVAGAQHDQAFLREGLCIPEHNDMHNRKCARRQQSKKCSEGPVSVRVAGVSVLWMGSGFNYYTSYSAQ